MSRLISLAAGTVLDVDPPGTVDVAARSGFDAVGIWFDPESWTAETTRAVAARLHANDITALDMEPVILGRDIDPGDALVDTAVELGVRHVLVASGPADRSAVVDRLGELCRRVEGTDVVLVLEFLPIFTVGKLSAAVGIVEEIGHQQAAVLVDTLHLARSGGTPSDLEAVPARLLPYLQIADAPAEPPGTDRGALRDEALNSRLLPGDGELPLSEVLAVVPNVPLSLELRSAPLMTTYPDPNDRARAVLAATQRLLN